MEAQQARRNTACQANEKQKTEEPDWWAEFCKESAVHGMPYLARKDLHWSERLFWVSMIVAATYYAMNSCYLQWDRYRNNPIVYEYEYLYGLRNVSMPAFTICYQLPSVNQTDDLIYDFWNLNTSLDVEKGDYYKGFLLTLNYLQFDNLETLKPYELDDTLQNVDFVQILLQLQSSLLPQPGDTRTVTHVPSLTEVGLCKTNSNLWRFGNPYGNVEHFDLEPAGNASIFETNEFRFVIADKTILIRMYIHDQEDVMLPQDRRTLLMDIGDKLFYRGNILVNPFMAEEDVRSVPIAYRKCRFRDESYLKYFNVYNFGVCRLECRIRVAHELCHCKPFFYVAAPRIPICDIKGMLCLARKKWLDTPCPCSPVCVENIFIRAQAMAQGSSVDYSGVSYERSLSFDYEIPKMGIKRRVVFSVDQLIMSLGGAIGLFLGASFMTIYGLIYMTMYFLIVKCKMAPGRWRRRKRNIRSP